MARHRRRAALQIICAAQTLKGSPNNCPGSRVTFYLMPRTLFAGREFLMFKIFTLDLMAFLDFDYQSLYQLIFFRL